MHKRSSRKFVHSSKAKVQDVLLLAMIAVRARHVAFGHSRLRTKDNAGTKQQLDRGDLLQSSLQSWANTRREAVRRRKSLINQKGGGGCGTPTTADALIINCTIFGFFFFNGFNYAVASTPARRASQMRVKNMRLPSCSNRSAHAIRSRRHSNHADSLFACT